MKWTSIKICASIYEFNSLIFDVNFDLISWNKLFKMSGIKTKSYFSLSLKKLIANNIIEEIRDKHNHKSYKIKNKKFCEGAYIIVNSLK